MSGKHDRASELRAIAGGRLLLNVRNGVTVSRSMLAMIADELDAAEARIAALEAQLAEAKRFIEMALDYEGDVFGRHHNDVVDLLL